MKLELKQTNMFGSDENFEGNQLNDLKFEEFNDINIEMRKIIIQLKTHKYIESFKMDFGLL